jgi:hypothetical protein
MRSRARSQKRETEKHKTRQAAKKAKRAAGAAPAVPAHVAKEISVTFIALCNHPGFAENFVRNLATSNLSDTGKYTYWGLQATSEDVDDIKEVKCSSGGGDCYVVGTDVGDTLLDMARETVTETYKAFDGSIFQHSPETMSTLAGLLNKPEMLYALLTEINGEADADRRVKDFMPIGGVAVDVAAARFCELHNIELSPPKMKDLKTASAILDRKGTGAASFAGVYVLSADDDVALYVVAMGSEGKAWCPRIADVAKQMPIAGTVHP